VPGVAQMNAGESPAGFLMHGFPQQSALVAHALPAGGALVQVCSVRILQRGMPLSSSWHVGNWFALPEQQSIFVLHDCAPPEVSFPGLQSCPAELHTVLTYVHVPNAAPADFAHRTAVDGSLDVPSRPPLYVLTDPGWFSTPQQSAVVWQMLPIMRQPDSCWQIAIPDVPLGAHDRLQQSAPVHVPLGEQSSPAVLQPVDVVSGAHVPVPAPGALLHRPEQHAPSLVHVSPSTVQNPGFAHTPLLLQKPDAHCEFVEHGLPGGGGGGFSEVGGLHSPVPAAVRSQFWLQQSLFWLHTFVSAWQNVVLQVPAVQVVVQQPAVRQLCPGVWQPMASPQVCAPSGPVQLPEQHSPPATQATPLSLQIPGLISDGMIPPSGVSTGGVTFVRSPPASADVMPVSFSLPQPPKTSVRPDMAVTSESAAHVSFLIEFLPIRRC
jgi:hypothetical protein